MISTELIWLLLLFLPFTDHLQVSIYFLVISHLKFKIPDLKFSVFSVFVLSSAFAYFSPIQLALSADR